MTDDNKKKSGKEAREARAAEALRANLRRRKAGKKPDNKGQPGRGPGKSDRP